MIKIEQISYLKAIMNLYMKKAKFCSYHFFNYAKPAQKFRFHHASTGARARPGLEKMAGFSRGRGPGRPMLASTHHQARQTKLTLFTDIITSKIYFVVIHL